MPCSRPRSTISTSSSGLDGASVEHIPWHPTGAPRLRVQHGEGFLAIVRVVIDMGDLQALELVHAADSLASEHVVAGLYS